MFYKKYKKKAKIILLNNAFLNEKTTKLILLNNAFLNEQTLHDEIASFAILS